MKGELSVTSEFMNSGEFVRSQIESGNRVYVCGFDFPRDAFHVFVGSPSEIAEFIAQSRQRAAAMLKETIEDAFDGMVSKG